MPELDILRHELLAHGQHRNSWFVLRCGYFQPQVQHPVKSENCAENNSPIAQFSPNLIAI